VSWHASTDLEADEIRRAVGTDSTVRVAPEIIRQRPPQPSAPKEVGRVRLIFASRITPKKNLAYLLQVLRKVRGEVILTIHGPIQHPDYWDRCKRLIDALPSNIQVTYEGPLTHERLQARLQSCHFVALPTLSENFGHVIIEAMLAGRPVIISDATPWRELAASGAGWDLPIGLAAEETWCEVIDRCVQMDDAVYRRMSTSANEHATRWIGEAGAPGLHRDMFNMVMSA
jgi:glycosyltransferase involved in cell wall biosynthesis